MDIAMGITDGRLAQVPVVWKKDPAVCIVVSSEGYPGGYRKGDVISGLDASVFDSGITGGVQTVDASVDAGTAECAQTADCRLVTTICCTCQPPQDASTVIAVPIDSPSQDRTCDAVCDPCPAPTLPQGVIADCVAGTCEVAKLATEVYSQCTLDSDCALIPTSCCGWCGDVTMWNSYSVSDTDELSARCLQPVACPLIACPMTTFSIEAYCTAEGYCSARAL